MLPSGQLFGSVIDPAGGKPVANGPSTLSIATYTDSVPMTSHDTTTSRGPCVADASGAGHGLTLLTPNAMNAGFSAVEPSDLVGCVVGGVVVGRLMLLGGDVAGGVVAGGVVAGRLVLLGGVVVAFGVVDVVVVDGWVAGGGVFSGVVDAGGSSAIGARSTGAVDDAPSVESAVVSSEAPLQPTARTSATALSVTNRRMFETVAVRDAAADDGAQRSGKRASTSP